MMRTFMRAGMKAGLIAMAALLAAAAPPPKPPQTAASARPPVAGNWNSLVRVSPDGTYIVGNPAAPVKLVEYLSFTCPHCAAFAVESAGVFRGQMIKSGSVMVEYRPVVRDSVDLAATLLLRCIGPQRFADAGEAVFKQQQDWLPLAVSFLEHDANRFALDPPLERLKITAQLSGLIELFRNQGMTGADIDRCFTDAAALRQAVAVGEASQKVIKGTPSFFINGAEVSAFEWSQLEPLLRAKGAK